MLLSLQASMMHCSRPQYSHDGTHRGQPATTGQHKSGLGAPPNSSQMPLNTTTAERRSKFAKTRAKTPPISGSRSNCFCRSQLPEPLRSSEDLQGKASHARREACNNASIGQLWLELWPRGVIPKLPRRLVMRQDPKHTTNPTDVDLI